MKVEKRLNIKIVLQNVFVKILIKIYLFKKGFN